MLGAAACQQPHSILHMALLHGTVAATRLMPILPPAVVNRCRFGDSGSTYWTASLGCRSPLGCCSLVVTIALCVHKKA
jgi:hypothetical protein